MKIYGLHAGDYKIRYVGATTLPLEDRLRLHLNKSRRYGSSSSVHQWLRTESDVQILEIEDTDDEMAEEKWIAILDTYRLGVNSLPQGRPVAGSLQLKHSRAARQKISEASRASYESGRRSREKHPNFVGYAKGTPGAMEIGRKASKKLKGERWECECGMVSAKSGIVRHQYYSGHTSMKQVVFQSDCT